MVNPEQSKIELVRVLCKILGMAERNFQLNTYIINCLTYKIRKTVREVVDDSMKYFPGAYIPSVINTTIRYKSSYIEFTFYNQIDLVRYFMECEHVSPELIATLHERLMKNIEVLYYLNSPSKKMLKDMGIYDGDIDSIISVIGNNFSSIADLQSLLAQNYDKLISGDVYKRQGL